MMHSPINSKSRKSSRSRSRKRARSARRGAGKSRGLRMSRSHGVKRRRSPHSYKVKRLRTKHQSRTKICMRPGPITNNGYLNFLRDYRRTCCGMTPQETVRCGARKWVSMSEKEKDKYRRTASKVKGSRRSSRRSRRNVC